MAEMRADGKPGVKNQQEEHSKQMRRWFAPKKFDAGNQTNAMSIRQTALAYMSKEKRQKKIEKEQRHLPKTLEKS